MLNWLSQVATVTWLNLRTIGQRRGASLAAAIGVAGVVAVFVTTLSIAEGFRRTLMSGASPDTAIVMRSGSDSEMMSGLQREATRIIAEKPGVARSAQGPVASAELYVVADIPKRSTGTDANVPLRGVQPAAFDVRKEVKIVQGRRFEPGRSEVIVGRAASQEFAGLDLGSKLHFGQAEWTVVGIFTAGGSIAESEIWCDVGVLQPAYRRGDSFQAVYAKLESAAAFDTFKDNLTRDPRLDVKVIREADYYAGQTRTINGIITGLGYLIASLMAVGAVFGAINTMYTAVSSRTREIATLRALGFRNGPVVISVLAESLLLALAGGLLGAAIAYFAFNGYQTATMNWSSFSQVAFSFAVTPWLLVQGLVYSLIMGLVGGLFPAIRAARLPVATALREL
ncbi:MAG: putative transport system permease protein [Acidobacteriota bacterium]|jgi:putative ABC transport system permease protein|nr:putative transport system permease protein [Acidobacteriota bacterium]